MALAAQVEMTKQELDAVAWRFLGSQFTDLSSAEAWPFTAGRKPIPFVRPA